MSPIIAIAYSFLFGLLHGALPDEHTWPITFSYAIGGASGRQGLKAGLLFSAAFTVQRAVMAELAYLALAPFLRTPSVNGVVYVVVGVVMSAAGALLLRRGRYVHVHTVGHHHDDLRELSSPGETVRPHHRPAAPDERAGVPPVHWTLVHGFIAGFGIGGFALFVNTVAVPAMGTAWLGFVPGLVYGIGTMVTLVAVSVVVGASLRWTHLLTEQELTAIGAKTGGRSLFFGGFLFAVAGVATLLGWGRYSPVDPAYLVVGVFLVLVVVPALVFSVREVVGARRRQDDLQPLRDDGREHEACCDQAAA